MKKLDCHGNTHILSPYEHSSTHRSTPPTICMLENSLLVAIKEELTRKHGSTPEQIYQDLQSILLSQYPWMSLIEINAEITKRTGGIII